MFEALGVVIVVVAGLAMVPAVSLVAAACRLAFKLALLPLTRAAGLLVLPLAPRGALVVGGVLARVLAAWLAAALPALVLGGLVWDVARMAA